MKIRPNPIFPRNSLDAMSRELGVLWRELSLAFDKLTNQVDDAIISGSTLEVLDEGVSVEDTVTSINFVGAAVAATSPSAGAVTVTADPDILMADTADILTAGFATTDYNVGTKSSGTFTPNEANGNLQYLVNGGAFTLAPPTNSGTMILQITNNASAGAITTSGWTMVTNAAPALTDGNDYLAYIVKINGFSHLTWIELQ